MLSIWPMLMGMAASHASCTSLVYSMKKRAVKDGGQAETEIEARTDFLRIFMVKHVSGNEKYEIANGFIELAGMAWQHVDALEDESPRHVGRFADDFRVHQVAQTDEHGTGWSGDGNVVQYTHDIQFRFPDVKPKGKHQAYRTAVAGQSGVTGERPTVGRLPHGQDHFQGVGEEVARFVEQAVPQTGAYEDAHETIEEQRVEQFGRRCAVADTGVAPIRRLPTGRSTNIANTSARRIRRGGKRTGRDST